MDQGRVIYWLLLSCSLFVCRCVWNREELSMGCCCHVPCLSVGVFGSGKSYLLAVVVMFLARLFELNETYTSDAPTKLLISSSTNVAVDRILLR